MRAYSEKMVRACNDTIRAYRELISGRGDAKLWFESYGSIGGCRLCCASVSDENEQLDIDFECSACPLYHYAQENKDATAAVKVNLGCVSAACSAMYLTHDNLKAALLVHARDDFSAATFEQVVSAAKARLSALVAAFEQQGIAIDEDNLEFLESEKAKDEKILKENGSGV